MSEQKSKDVTKVNVLDQQLASLKSAAEYLSGLAQNESSKTEEGTKDNLQLTLLEQGAVTVIDSLNDMVHRDLNKCAPASYLDTADLDTLLPMLYAKLGNVFEQSFDYYSKKDTTKATELIDQGIKMCEDGIALCNDAQWYFGASAVTEELTILVNKKAAVILRKEQNGQ